MYQPTSGWTHSGARRPHSARGTISSPTAWPLFKSGVAVEMVAKLRAKPDALDASHSALRALAHFY